MFFIEIKNFDIWKQFCTFILLDSTEVKRKERERERDRERQKERDREREGG